MSENESSLFHLELIRQRNLSEQEADILSAFARGISWSPDVTGETHEGLVGILGRLRQFAKGELNTKRRVWKDLPLLPMCMEAYFNDPSSETGDFNPKSAQIWRNLNSFVSRCLGVGIAGPYYQAITVGEMSSTECRIQVALEDEANYIERGTLYHGPPTMCLQRWGFWLDNFKELGKEESAEQNMRTIERGIGHTLSE
ncbi:hypothetical protein V8E51_000033 [Hyaloscypha variabilis]